MKGLVKLYQRDIKTCNSGDLIMVELKYFYLCLLNFYLSFEDLHICIFDKRMKDQCLSFNLVPSFVI